MALFIYGLTDHSCVYRLCACTFPLLFMDCSTSDLAAKKLHGPVASSLFLSWSRLSSVGNESCHRNVPPFRIHVDHECHCHRSVSSYGNPGQFYNELSPSFSPSFLQRALFSLWS